MNEPREIVADDNGVEFTSTDALWGECVGCHFANNEVDCLNFGGLCTDIARPDGRNVVWLKAA